MKVTSLSIISANPSSNFAPLPVEFTKTADTCFVNTENPWSNLGENLYQIENIEIMPIIPKTPAEVFGEHIVGPVTKYIGKLLFQVSDKLKSVANTLNKALMFPGAEANEVSTVTAVPLGAILAFPVEQVPAGFLECNGQVVLRNTYPELFALLGVRYGIGDAITTFGLPDYRGYFLRGWDHGAGIDPDGNARVLGTRQNDRTKLPTNPFITTVSDPHTHEVLAAGYHRHFYIDRSYNIVAGGGIGSGGAGLTEQFTNRTSDESGNHSHPLSAAGAHSHIIKGGDSETCPINMNVMWVIRAQPMEAAAALNIEQLNSTVETLQRQLETLQSHYESLHGMMIGTAVASFAVASIVMVIAGIVLCNNYLKTTRNNIRQNFPMFHNDPFPAPPPPQYNPGL